MTRIRTFLPCALLAFASIGLTLPAQVRFEDVTQRAGITWTHRNGATSEKYLIETMGGGGAFLDFDRDGWMDIFLVDSGSHLRSDDRKPARNALYRNNRDGTFTDVTQRAGLLQGCYGMGVAVGDVDNDGLPDIYLTCYGGNRLYRNRGDGTFEDTTTQSGTAVGLWSTSAAFFDLENDGDLDLFVCVYMEWDYSKNIYCGDKREGRRSYCHPQYFAPISSRLLANDGQGRFEDVTAHAGVNLPAKALGVVTGDLNGDSLPDIYVANDTLENHLYLNKGNGVFEERGLIAEVAYGPTVKPESGMGTDFGDFDGNGSLDLIVTNIDFEMNNLYANQEGGFFSDRTLAAGLGQVAILYSGFGVRFLDFDNDGDLDLTVLNGHVLPNIASYKSNVSYAEPPLLLENRGGRYLDVGKQSGEVWQRSFVGRALAVGDYDNDGDVDLLFVNNGQAPVLLRNQGGNRGPWIGIRLRSRQGGRTPVGARVTLLTDRREIVREVSGGASYQAAHDQRILFGFNDGEVAREMRIRWPGGSIQTLPAPAAGRYHDIRQADLSGARSGLPPRK